MVKNTFKRLLALLLVTIMIVGVVPVSASSTGSVTNYSDFMKNLKVLETYANEYASQIHGRDVGELVLNFIRTGVERYQDDNWTTLAGQEIVGFTSYVESQDNKNGTTAMDLRDIVISDFKLPNGNQVDFGHMFGCMNISYVAVGSADLSGWAGDLCDLLRYCVEDAEVPAGTVDEMAAYILEYCLGEDAANAYGQDDIYGDMDAFYLVSEYKKGGKTFSQLMEEYFTADLSDLDRAVYFVNNRFGVEDAREAVRKALYESYSSDVGIKILESKRGLTTYNALREACCYALADYLYNIAGGKGLFIPSVNEDQGAENGYYSVFSSEKSILAPGISQEINYAQTVDGKQIVYYVATVDVNREDVTIMANYKDNDPSKGWGLESVAEQVKDLVANHADEKNFYPIVATNGDGYNITNGTPGGLLVMEGKEWYGVDHDGFFAILKDGTAMIGTEADYEIYKDQIQEAIGGFGAVLVKDGKINVTKNANYTSSRASRTAIGIKEDGSVVMMVLDGRQLPRSAGGSMEEIAQIMYEAGCVHAINLDGGGSTTYLSKPAGSDEIQLTNVPSDGYERSVAVSLVAISTAPPSTAFDRAIVSSDYDYITAGTSMQFGVIGVSNTGNAASIPENSTWQVDDEGVARIDSKTGLFTAIATGEVTVEFVVDGAVKGSKTIYVVVPDDIKFVEDRITAIYGVPKDIDITVWYKGYPVAFTPLRDAFVFFSYTLDVWGNISLNFDSPAGSIVGLSFTGSDENNIRSINVYAALMAGEKIIDKAANINLYYKDEATFDFENATQGNRKLAWNREITNAKSTDNQLYRISDPESPIEIDYTFALDITAIDFPPQLEPIKSMLPTYQEGATAWTYLLQLAERVCVQSKVTIRAEFSKDLAVDISNLKIINDYFTLTSANIDENNVLTLVCNWVNQSQPIDPATANPLCVLSGIKATVKDSAAYYNNEILVANNGYVSYDIYLAASSLYSFAENPKIQSEYGLYPYIHEEDCRGEFSEDLGDDETLTNNDKGARFSSQYIDFADIYVINNEIRQGWQEEGKDYYYYVDNEPLTGVQLVADRKDATQKRFYEFDMTGKLVSEQGVSGLVPHEGALYYAVNGVAQTGWQQIDGDNYYFHPDTGKALDGVQQIRESVYPNTSDTNTAIYTYTFENYILVRGDLRRDNNYGQVGIRYRWAGEWAKGCWFEVDGNTYHVEKNYPYFITTGYGHYIHDFAGGQDSTNCFLFDENGVLQKDYVGPATVMVGSTEMTYFFKNGERFDTTRDYFARGFHRGTDGYYYYVAEWDGTIIKATAGTTVNRWLTEGVSVLANSKNSDGSFTFDDQGRVLNKMATVEEKPESVTTEEQGGVLTVTPEAEDTAPCRVGYFENGNYVTVSGTKAENGGYKFIVPPTARVAIVVIGDVDGNGQVDEVTEDEITTLVDIALGKVTDSEEPIPEETAKAALAGDMNGDGKITAADIAQLIAMGLDKIDAIW